MSGNVNFNATQNANLVRPKLDTKQLQKNAAGTLNSVFNVKADTTAKHKKEIIDGTVNWDEKHTLTGHAHWEDDVTVKGKVPKEIRKQ